MPAEIENPEISRIKQHYLRRDESGFTRQRYGISERGNVLLIEELQRQMQFLIARRKGMELDTKRILDVGCGSGYWLRQFIQWGARPENLFGIDLLPERIAKARELCPSAVHLECGDASTLSFADRTFDMAFQATVFGAILDFRMKEAIAGEIVRVLKPGGCLLWYDFFVNNPSNSDVRGVRKKEILQLFPGCRAHLRTVTLAPPFGRIVGKISPFAYHAISMTKIFCTHYLGFIDKA